MSGTEYHGAYGIRILGNEMAPDLPDGSVAVFDPASTPHAGDIVAVWLQGATSPTIVRLGLAVPPPGKYVDLEPQLGVQEGGFIRMVPMARVRHVHPFVRIADPREVAS